MDQSSEAYRSVAAEIDSNNLILDSHVFDLALIKISRTFARALLPLVKKYLEAHLNAPVHVKGTPR